MVGLARAPEDYGAAGFTPKKQAASLARIAREQEMPIDTRERPRMAATLPACRAVVAARLKRPRPSARSCARTPGALLLRAS